MASATRQHYNLATGGALAATDGSSKVLKYAKGGKVSAYRVGTNANGARVSGANSDNKYLKVKGNFKTGANVSGLKGDDKFTTITQQKKHLAKGFKVQKP
jgi:hypothetical protein